ncbi:MAG: tetratricopeptide repeat protein [Bacteroidetes bacterium]|nr:tetratricopeptide repeat protein [Bacteroidota bacterium]
MDTYLIVAISSVFLIFLILLLRNRAASKHKLGYKDAMVLDNIMDENSEKGIITKKIVTKTRADSVQNNISAFNKSEQKIKFNNNVLLENIAENIVPSKEKENGGERVPSFQKDDHRKDVSGTETISTTSVKVDNQNYEMGLLLIEKKRFNQAIEYFSKAIELNPADGAPYFYRGEAKNKLNLLNDAIEDYTDAMLQKLNMVDVFYKRGYCKFKLGDKSGALKDFTKYVSIDKHNPEAYYYKGLLEYEAKNYSVVIDDLNRAIELNPNHESAYFKRGMAKEKTGDKNGCCNDLKTAVDKGNLEAYHYQKKFCS